MPFASNLNSATLGGFIGLKWAQEMNSAIACAHFLRAEALFSPIRLLRTAGFQHCPGHPGAA